MITSRHVEGCASQYVTLARASNPRTLNGYLNHSLRQNQAMEQGWVYGSAKESLRSIRAPYDFEACVCMTGTSLAFRCSFQGRSWPLRSQVTLCAHSERQKGE